jgi:hypothetical protein
MVVLSKAQQDWGLAGMIPLLEAPATSAQVCAVQSSAARPKSMKLFLCPYRSAFSCAPTVVPIDPDTQ